MARSGLSILRPWFSASGDGWIEGAKVYLRTPQMDDFDEWRDLRLKSRAFLEPWEPSWDESEYTRAAFRQRIRRYHNLLDEDAAQALFVFDRRTRLLVGGVTLSNIRRGVSQSATLGYWIGKSYAGQGLMTDAIGHLVPFAFSTLRLHRVEAACLPRNIPSARLLTRCGFEQEGLARSYLKIAGNWEDHLLFARLSDG